MNMSLVFRETLIVSLSINILDCINLQGMRMNED